MIRRYERRYRNVEKQVKKTGREEAFSKVSRESSPVDSRRHSIFQAADLWVVTQEVKPSSRPPQKLLLPLTCHSPTPPRTYSLDRSGFPDSMPLPSTFPQLAQCSWPLVFPSPLPPPSRSFLCSASFRELALRIPQPEGSLSSLFLTALATVFL